jgi:hypothetical protein
MQPVPEADVVVCGVVIGGGVTCVVVCDVVAGGGGGGGAACVVVVGAGGALVVVWVVAVAVAAVLCAAGLACGCRLGLAGLAAVVVAVVAVVGVDWVAAAGVVAAAGWLEVDEAEPQALTTSVNRTAAIGMRRCLISVSLPPGFRGSPQRTPPTAGCFPDLNNQ